MGRRIVLAAAMIVATAAPASAGACDNPTFGGLLGGPDGLAEAPVVPQAAAESPALPVAQPTPAPAVAAASQAPAPRWSRTRASWYAIGPARTGYTAAHRTLPKGTRLEVCSLAGRCVQVVINDRGPYITGRDLDLSKHAFAALASPSVGVLEVRWRVL